MLSSRLLRRCCSTLSRKRLPLRQRVPGGGWLTLQSSAPSSPALSADQLCSLRKRAHSTDESRRVISMAPAAVRAAMATSGATEKVSLLG